MARSLALGIVRNAKIQLYMPMGQKWQDKERVASVVQGPL